LGGERGVGKGDTEGREWSRWKRREWCEGERGRAGGALWQIKIYDCTPACGNIGLIYAYCLTVFSLFSIN